jgi:hypothetical protein
MFVIPRVYIIMKPDVTSKLNSVFNHSLIREKENPNTAGTKVCSWKQYSTIPIHLLCSWHISFRPAATLSIPLELRMLAINCPILFTDLNYSYVCVSVHVTVYRNKFLYNKTNRSTNFPNLLWLKNEPLQFRAVLLLIIRCPLTVHLALVYSYVIRFEDSFRAGPESRPCSDWGSCVKTLSDKARLRRDEKVLLCKLLIRTGNGTSSHGIRLKS